MPITTEEIDQFEQGVTDLITFLRAHPDALEYRPSLVLSNWVYPESKHEDPAAGVIDQLRYLAANARHRAPIGAVEKVHDDYQFGIRRHFGPLVTYLAVASPEMTCSYEETDEVELVEEMIVPDVVKKALTRTVERPVLKRVCARLIPEGKEVDL